MTPLWLRRRRYRRFTRHASVSIRRRLVRSLALLLLVFLVHVVAMILAEDLSLADAVWLTITTATTVGYGDLSAETWLGRLATIGCLYLFGIFLLGQAAGSMFEYRATLREHRRRGDYRWKDMNDHLLILNVPARGADEHLARLIYQLRSTPAFEYLPVQLVTPHYADGLPKALEERGVVHLTRVAEDSANLAAANVARAAYVVVIAEDASDPRSDAHTYDILGRIHALLDKERVDPERRPVIVAEVVADANRERIRAAGATAVVRPVRAYPGLVVRALVAPGVEQVIETMFTHDADRLARFEAPFEELAWSDVLVCCVRGGAGVPLGYYDKSGVNTNPPPSEVCSGDGLIVLVDESQEVTEELVVRCLAEVRAKAA